MINTDYLKFEKNEKWRKLKHETDECDVFQAEVTENETNKNLCDDAKEKEQTNFENYNVFEEVPFDNQKVLGTRFVLTKKPDGTIKARLVTKGGS